MNKTFLNGCGASPNTDKNGGLTSRNTSISSMELRDLFVAQLLSNDNLSNEMFKNDNRLFKARQAYLMADAMLEARDLEL